MAFKADSDDPRESLSYKLRKVLEYEAGEVLCTDVYIKDPASCRSRGARRGPTCCSSARRTASTGRCDLPATSRSSTSGTSTGKGRCPREDPRHRLRRLHRRLPRRGAARRRARGRRARQLLEVRARRARLRRPPALSRRRRATPRTSACSRTLLADCDHFVAGAAIIGGISLFHELAYDLLAENERITAAAFDAAICGPPRGASCRRSPSSRRRWSSRAPTSSRRPRASSAAARRRARPTASRSSRPSTSPRARASSTACRTRSSGRSTASAIGEKRALSDNEVISGNVKLAMSHVVPDLVQKVLKGQDPLHILGDGQQVRHYTYGGDLARGIRLAIESPAALNEDFNLSTARLDHRARAGRADLAEGPRRRAVPLSSPTRPTPTTCRSASRRSRRPGGSSGFEATTTPRRGARRDHPLDPGTRSQIGGI